MDKLDINECFFHSLSPINYDGLKSHKEDQEIQTLSQILDSKAILSRRMLRFVNKSKYNALEQCQRTCWNGDRYISVSASLQNSKNYPEHYMELPSYMGYNRAYDSYPLELTSIILSPKIIEDLPINTEPTNNLYGEVQIEDKIPSEYFLGISIPGKYIEIPDNVIDNYDLFISTLRAYNDKSYIQLKSLKTLSVKEYLEENCRMVLLIDQLLREKKSNLKLYDIYTGEIITIGSLVARTKKLKKFVCEKNL